MLKSLTILCCSLLKWKHTASTTLAVIDVLDLVTQKYTDVLPCFIEAISPWFTHKDAEMKQLLYHHIASISSSLPFFHFCFRTFWYLQTNASHVRRARFTVEVDFYFMLTQFWDMIIETLVYLVEPPVSSSLVPADCLHHLREGLWKDVYTLRLCVHSPLCFSFQRILFSWLAPGFG